MSSNNQVTTPSNGRFDQSIITTASISSSNNNNNNTSMASSDFATGCPDAASLGHRPTHGPRHTMDSSMLADPSSPSVSLASLKELKKSYHMRKKYFTKNVQSAIESTQEVHSGWLKARTNFKRWTKVWCQVKPGYLILYTSQEALKKHRLGVVLLSVCQVIKRPTRKEGFCFKLINPFGCSVWAKSSTKALVFAQASLTLRSSDSSIGKLWLDALNQCHLSSNLEGYQAVVDEDGFTRDAVSHQSDEVSESGDDASERHLDSLLNTSNSTSDINSTISTLNNNVSSFRVPNTPSINGKAGNSRGRTEDSIRGLASPARAVNCPPSIQVKQKIDTSTILGISKSNKNNNNNNNNQSPSQLVVDKKLNNNHSISGQAHVSCPMAAARPMPPSSQPPTGAARNQSQPASASAAATAAAAAASASVNLNSSKMVAKFVKYHWRELQLENVNYTGDGAEVLEHAGAHIEEVQEGNKHLLWHLIKQLRPGMDLSKVTLPTFILEPRSFLEKLADYYYHCDILSEATLVDDPVARLTTIVKWYLSGFYKKPKGPKKPYNPILGERFRCFWDHPKTKSRTFFVAEQVSHHPPISAFHVANRKDGYTITCALLSKSKYTGNSVSAILDGRAKLHLTKRNETYNLTMPYANCRGILLGSLCLELGGRVEIECAQTKCKCELDFKIASMWAGADSYNTLTGKIIKDNKVAHTLDGHWDRRIDIVDKATNKKSTLWEVTDAVKSSRLKCYKVSLKDQGERESVKLWSRVTAALVDGNQVEATVEKTRLEDMQRKEARERLEPFRPEHFEAPPAGTHEWRYRWQDDRVWNERRDIMQFEDNFRIRTLMMDNDPPIVPLDPTIDLPLTQLSNFAPQVKSLVAGVMAKPLVDAGGRALSLSELTPDTVKSIESKIAAGNLLFEEAIKQVTEKNRKLEEDIATLQRARSKRTIALLATVIIVAMISFFYKYFV